MKVSYIEAQTERVMTSGELLAKGKSYSFVYQENDMCKISKVNILLKKGFNYGEIKKNTIMAIITIIIKK